MSDDEDLFDVFNVSTSTPSVAVPDTVASPPPTATSATAAHASPGGSQAVAIVSSPPSLVDSVPTPARPTVTPADLMQLTATHASVSTFGASPSPTPSAHLSSTSATHARALLSAAASPAGFAVVSAPALHDRDGDDRATSHGPAAPDPVKTYIQKESGIRVKHATSSLVQLPLFTAGAPITAFAAVQRWLASPAKDEAAMAHTCIGTVVRKSEPKMGARQAYAVITLWDMQGGSPTPSHELAFLLCGAAFEHVLNKAVVGTVMAISQLARVRGGAGDAKSSSSLLRLSSVDALRLLGFAADLGTCESTAHKSGERCTALVNQRQTRHCVYHLADVRKVASGSAMAAAGKRTPLGGVGAKTPIGAAAAARAAPVMKGGALTTHINFSAKDRPAVVEAKQLLKRQQMNLFTVHGRSGLPTQSGTHDASMKGAGIYTGVHSGSPLPVTGLMSDTAAQFYPSAQSLGVSTRGRDALAVARQQEDAERTRQLLRRASAQPSATATAATGLKRAREEDLSGRARSTARGSGTLASRRQAVEALKQQFAPLPAVGSVPSPSSGRTASTVSTSTAASRGAGARNLLVGAVSRAIAKGAIPLSEGPAPTQASQGLLRGPSGRAANTTAAILSAAATAKSSLDHLRVQVARDQLDAYFDGEMTREKAREVLEAVTEQSVRGTYCFGCKNWYMKLPKSCVEAHHRTESRETKKRYIQCTLCQHKTFVLGESTVPAKVLPVCPQCKQHTAWRSSNAAPVIQDAPEEVHPF